MLFIIHNTEDGLRCQQIEHHEFGKWVKDHTDNIQSEYHPQFVAQMPTDMSETYEFLVIDGRIVKPTPRTVVTAYDLD